MVGDLRALPPTEYNEECAKGCAVSKTSALFVDGLNINSGVICKGARERLSTYISMKRLTTRQQDANLPDYIASNRVIHHPLLRNTSQRSIHFDHAVSWGEQHNGLAGSCKIPVHIMLIQYVQTQVYRF